MLTVRVAAHVHSNWSYDAAWTLPALAKALSRCRYDVVLMAEHDPGFTQSRWEDYRRACANASDEQQLLVPEIEYEDPENVVHTPVWGVPFLGSGRQTREILTAAGDSGAVAILAHRGGETPGLASTRRWYLR
jgi:hypothetical protein